MINEQISPPLAGNHDEITVNALRITINIPS